MKRKINNEAKQTEFNDDEFAEKKLKRKNTGDNGAKVETSRRLVVHTKYEKHT